MAVREILASNIRTRADKSGVGVNELADFAGVSRSQLYDVLAGKKGATVDWVDKIAAVLKVPVHELLQQQARRKRN